LGRKYEEVVNMDKPITTIAQRLKEALTASGKKQADVVRETGLDRGAVSSYLSGKYEPKQKAIYKMAKVLNVNEAWLMGYDVPMGRTIEAKKNDRLAELVVKMRSEPAFFDAVASLAELTPEQFDIVKGVIEALPRG
jgi:transcriptional regulator with XRE-family HTH domain